MIQVLCGPTASGKTQLAIDAGLWLQSHKQKTLEVINLDSQLVYKGADIGTAKPSLLEQAGIAHHLIDTHALCERSNAADVLLRAEETYTDILKRSNLPLFVGGSGFYLQALIFGMWDAPQDLALRRDLETWSSERLFAYMIQVDPHSTIHPNDRYRLQRAVEIYQITGKTQKDFSHLKPKRHTRLFVLDLPRDKLEERIRARTKLMLKIGLLDEAQHMLTRFPSSPVLESIGYLQAGRFLKGQKPKGRLIAEGLQGLEDEINLATIQMLKRQKAWFKRLATRVTEAVYLSEPQVESFAPALCQEKLL